MKNLNILIISAISLILVTVSCNDFSSIENQSVSKDHTLESFFTLNEVLDKDLEFISNSENSLTYKSDSGITNIIKDGELIYIENDHFKLELNFDHNMEEIQSYFLNQEQSDANFDLISVKLFDKDNNLLSSDLLNDQITQEIDGLIYALQGCTSSNVLECVSNHCEDAGALLCAGCVLSKYCMAGLVAWCAAEVYYEIENPIHCEK